MGRVQYKNIYETVELRREHIYSQFINKHDNGFCLVCTVKELKVSISASPCLWSSLPPLSSASLSLAAACLLVAMITFSVKPVTTALFKCKLT